MSTDTSLTFQLGGTSRESATASISGQAATRASIASVPRTMAAIDGNARSRPARSTLTTPARVRPRSASTSRTNDRRRRAEPTSREHASAISATRSPRVKSRAARVSGPACRETRSASAGSVRVPSHAGMSPDRRTDVTPRPDATSSARTSMSMGLSVRPRKNSGTNDVRPQARPTPATAPESARSMCSAVACRISRARDAPRAAQRPNSRRRDDRCVRSRLLTFAHSTTNTSATPPRSNHMARRVEALNSRPPTASRGGAPR